MWMDIHVAARAHIEKMFNKVEGMKILLLDSETVFAPKNSQSLNWALLIGRNLEFSCASVLSLGERCCFDSLS